MFKNLTPRQIATYASVVITAIILLFVFGFRQMNLLLVNGSYLLAIMVLCFATSYFVILFFLEKFIYRKIKLIYKTIHRSKLSKKEKIDLNSDIIDEVEKEVVDWATDQQKEIDALKSLENYRREFLGNISHELKTPIFNIQGYLLTLLDGGLYDKKINESYLNRAAKNVERLQTIVEDLDSISKLESGRLVLEMQDFGIRQLTDEVFEDLEMLANEKNINLTFKEGAAVDFRVKADRESIRQVMTNLVTNSVKYGKENGYTKVSFYDMDKYILIEVADDGIGISKEHLNHVFDRFYRVDKSRSRQQGGSGLGLSIVKHIIEAHQQTINVRSVQGLGSTFGFTLAKA